jgi:hypothetical protein
MRLQEGRARPRPRGRERQGEERRARLATAPISGLFMVSGGFTIPMPVPAGVFRCCSARQANKVPNNLGLQLNRSFWCGIFLRPVLEERALESVGRKFGHWKSAGAPTSGGGEVSCERRFEVTD